MRKLIYILIPGLAAISACQRKLEVDSLGNFSVTADSAAYHAGGNATFTFSGSPNTITFYSGEPGHIYDLRNRVSEAGKATLQFSSALNAGVQTGSLALMASTDFKGVAVGDTATTIANIKAAKWTDITSRAKLAANATTTASGAIDLTDMAGTSVYLAFKYLGQAGSIQNKWTITGLTITNTLKDGSVYTIANLLANNSPITSNFGGVPTYSPGWVAYPVNNTFTWVVSAGTSLVITGASTAALATADSEAWTIMGPVDLTKVTPDVGVAIKGITLPLPSYTYVYGKAGMYKATFIAGNATRDAGASSVTALDVMVE